MFEYSFLVIAFYLSILSYYLGVLLYMIPLPFYSIKKWAPTLMVDGIFSATLIFSYTLILNLIEYLGRLFGNDWNSFSIWISLKIGLVIMLLISLKFIGVSLSLGGLQFLANSIISSLINSLTSVLFLLISISIASTIILTYGSKIMALGILLFSTPFRVTRSAGSMIISIVIVFSIGLPLMPVYVETLSQAPAFSETLLTEYGVTYGYINILDWFNDPLYKPVNKIYTVDEDIMLALYIGNEKGVIDASSPEKGFPSTKKYVIYVEYGGIRYRRIITPKNDYINYGGLYNLTIKMPLIQLSKLRFIYLKYCMAINKIVQDNAIVIKAKMSNDVCYIYLNVYKDEEVVMIINGTIVEPQRSIDYKWYGVLLKTLIYEVNLDSEKEFEIKIYINYQEHANEPQVSEVYYVRDSMGLYKFSPTDLIEPIVYIVFNLFIAPLTYIAILFSASIGLARVLGGALPSLARIILVGV